MITVTDVCFNFCAYCIHSERSKKRNYPLYPIPIDDYINFLSKIKTKSTVLITGGEPTLREDLDRLIVSTDHNFILYTSALYYDNSIKIFKAVEKNNTKLTLIPTFHHTSRNFNWDVFWNIIEKAKNISNIEIPHISLMDYKIKDVLKDVKKKCEELGLKLSIKPVDKSAVYSMDKFDCDKKNKITFFKKIHDKKIFRKI